MDTNDPCCSSGEDSWKYEESLFDTTDFGSKTKVVQAGRDSEEHHQHGTIIVGSPLGNNCLQLQDVNCSPVATLTSGLDASPEQLHMKTAGFRTPDEKSSRIKKARKKTPRTLSRMMKRHRESERNRHQGLNYGIIQLSRMVPGHNENQRETKVVIMQRVINYMVFIEQLVQSLRSDFGQGTGRGDLHLTSYLMEQSGENDTHPVLAEASQFLEPVDLDKTLRNIDKNLISEFQYSQQPSMKFGARRRFMKRTLSESSGCEGMWSNSQSNSDVGGSSATSTSDTTVPSLTSPESIQIDPSPVIVPRKSVFRCTPRTVASQNPCAEQSAFSAVSAAASVHLTQQNSAPNGNVLQSHVPYNWKFHNVQGGSGSERSRSDVRSSKRSREPETKKRRTDTSSRIDLRKTSWMNGFMMFSRINRKLYISERPGVPTSSISKLMGQAWRNMSAEEQQPYKEKARLYAQYMLEAYNLPEDLRKSENN